ncbi:MAG: PQQ-dependent sugar dehydrogenase [Phycisphaerales bacterium]|nr:PQQ-dependent sugar dehydrogenase [Phycisphaerales bacterium]
MCTRLWRVVAPIVTLALALTARADLAPLSIADVAAAPTPALADTAGASFTLRAGPAAAELRFEAVDVSTSLLLSIRGQDNMVNLVDNPAALAAPAPVRLTISAGSDPLVLPNLDVRFTDGGAAARVVYLPATSLAAGQSRTLWVASDGATFNGSPAQTSPSFVSLARGASGPWTVRQPGFRTEHIATDLQLPVAVAFHPGASSASPITDLPWCYIAERFGVIKLVRRNGATSDYATGLLNFTPGGAIPGPGEQGIGGLCVEPVTGDVIVSLLYDPAPPSTTRFARIVRLHSTDGGLTASSQSTLLDLPDAPQELPRQIGGLIFGPDGKLYVNNGDGSEPAAAIDNTSFKGKVLRINPDGSAPIDNPSTDGPPFTAIDYVYASGVRNPLGLAWRSLDGAAYFVDAAATTDRLARLVRARNYLWDGNDATMTSFALYNWPALGAAPNLTNVGADGIAFIQSQSFAGSGMPSGLYGRAYVTETGAPWTAGPIAGSKRICEFNIDASGSFVSGPIAVIEYNGTGRGTCAGIASGPDGLYFTTLYRDQGSSSATDPGADLVRVKYQGFAGMLAAPLSGPAAPLDVQFNDASTLIGATSWHWSFGDGATSTLRNPSHTYTAGGLYSVRLTVTGSSGTVTLKRDNLIRVGQPPSIAMIVGALPLAPTSADQAIVTRLIGLGYLVTVMDDEPTNRPGAVLIGQSHDLVLVSSSISSGNVAGEFRGTSIPMIFWESALFSTSRESLCDASTTAGSQNQLTIVNNAHPITQGLALGNAVMTASNQTFSFGNGNIAAQATVLATRLNTPANPAIMVAERGATLLNNYVTPARRVFLFFNDSTFNATNAAARAILDRSACWALGLAPAITAEPAPASIQPGQTAMFTVAASGQNPLSYQWRKDGAPLANDARISGATTTTLTISDAQPADSALYDVLVTNSCSSIASTPVMLTVAVPCPADINDSGGLSVQDIFDFLAAYFSNATVADFNNSGSITVQDLFDFLAAYFAGCA